VQRLPIFADTDSARVEIRTLHADGSAPSSVIVFATHAQAAKAEAARLARAGDRIETRAA